MNKKEYLDKAESAIDFVNVILKNHNKLVFSFSSFPETILDAFLVVQKVVYNLGVYKKLGYSAKKRISKEQERALSILEKWLRLVKVTINNTKISLVVLVNSEI